MDTGPSSSRTRAYGISWHSFSSSWILQKQQKEEAAAAAAAAVASAFAAVDRDEVLQVTAEHAAVRQAHQGLEAQPAGSSSSKTGLAGRLLWPWLAAQSPELQGRLALLQQEHEQEQQELKAAQWRQQYAAEQLMAAEADRQELVQQPLALRQQHQAELVALRGLLAAAAAAASPRPAVLAVSHSAAGAGGGRVAAALVDSTL